MATVLSSHHQLQPQSHQHNLHQIHHHQIHHHHQLLYQSNNNNSINTSATSPSSSASAATTTPNNNCSSFGLSHQQSNNSSFYGQQSHQQLQDHQSYQQHHPHHQQQQQQSEPEHFCKDCGVMFESSTSLEVHLSYHKETLLTRWATQEALDKSSSSATSVSVSTFNSSPVSGGLLLLNSPPSPSLPRHHNIRSSEPRGGDIGPLESYSNIHHSMMDPYNPPQYGNSTGDPHMGGDNSPYGQHRGSGPSSNGSVGSRTTPNGPSSNTSFGQQPPVDPPGYGESPNSFHPYSNSQQQPQQHPLFSPSTNSSQHGNDHTHQPPSHHSQGGPGQPGQQRDSSSAILDLDSHTVHIYQPPQPPQQEHGFYRPYLASIASSHGPPPPPPLSLPSVPINGWPVHATSAPEHFHLQLGPSPSRFSPAGYHLPVEHSMGVPVTFAAFVPPTTSSLSLSNGIGSIAMSPNNGFDRMRLENPGYLPPGHQQEQPGHNSSNGPPQFNVGPPGQGGVLANHLQGSGPFTGVGMHQQQFMIPQQQPPQQQQQPQPPPPPGLPQQNVISAEAVGGRPSPSPGGSGGRRTPGGVARGGGKKGGPSPGGTPGVKTKGWKGGECKRPKTYQCAACNKWFTSSGHLKRHYGTTLHKNSMKQLGDNAEELMRTMQQPKGKKGSGKGKASTAQGASTTRQRQSSSPPTPSTTSVGATSGIQSNGFLGGQPPPTRDQNGDGMDEQPPHSHLAPNSFSVPTSSGPGGYPTASPTSSAPYGPPPPTTLANNTFLEPPHLQQLHTPHHQHPPPPPPTSYAPNGPFNIDMVSMQSQNHQHHHNFPPANHHHNGYPSIGNGPLPPFSSVGLSHYESGGGSIPNRPPGQRDIPNGPSSNNSGYNSRVSPINTYHQMGGLNGGNPMQPSHSTTSPHNPGPVNNTSGSPGHLEMPFDSTGSSNNNHGMSRVGGGGGGSPGSMSGGGRDPGVGSGSGSTTSSLDGMMMMNMDGSEEDAGIGGSSSKSSSPGAEGSPSGEEASERKVNGSQGSSGRPREPEVLICPVCYKTFLRNCYLTQHVNSSHSGGKPFKCPTCGKKFHDEPDLADHVAKHGSEKPYKCESCPKQFNHKTDLKRHRSLHTGERPFTCPHCEKGFIRKDHMTKHTETHRKKDSKISKTKST